MHHFFFFPFCFIFIILIVGLIIANVRVRRYRHWDYDHGAHHAQSIAKRRLASGEISEEEYHKLMDLLKD